jgi:hypothetical protein
MDRFGALPAEKAGRAFRDKSARLRQVSLPAAIANAGQSTILSIKHLFFELN